MNADISQILLVTIFLMIVFLHVAKKNFEVVTAYGLQSLAVTLLMLGSFFETGSVVILLISLMMFIVKVVAAPIFFSRLIKKHGLTFSVTTYLNMPLTLIVVALLTAAAHSRKFAPLAALTSDHQLLLKTALAAIFVSLFLIVNRRGALSQMIGILSLENSIVAFTIFVGLEQGLGLEIGILFDIFVWFIIATIFISMIYKHFGSLDVTTMKHLKD